MRLNEHVGFVWGVDGPNMTIALRQGGKLVVPRGDQFDTGDRVAVIFDVSGKHVVQILTLKDAKHAIRCGIDPIYAAYSREPEELPLDEEEVLDDNFYCGETDDVYGIV